MTRISTPSFHQTSVNSLLDQQAKLSDTQLRISTGKRLLTPADDPIGASRLLNLKQQESETDGYQKSISTANFELSSEEVQLKNVQNQLVKARELAIQAGNGSLTAFNRINIATQMQNVLDQVVDTANATLDGNFMFSGSKSLDKPVIQDVNGVFSYRGDELNRQAKIGSSISVQVNDTAKRIFFQLDTNDVNVSATTGRHSLTSANPGLIDPALMGSLNSAELFINGIEINPAESDGVSTRIPTGSAIATANAINERSSLHGVVASVNATVFDFTGSTYSSGVLATGDFSINGVDIVGDIGAQGGADDLQSLILLINNSGLDGVSATSDGGGELRLTAQDGRNIELDTTGATASGNNFGNFDLTGGVLERVYRSTVTINDHNTISISTNTTTGNVNDVGFVPGNSTITGNTGSAAISTPIIREALPPGTTRDERYFVQFIDAATFNIYRESDPTTAVTNFKMFSSNENSDDAIEINAIPATYTTGDTVIIDGLEFTITGAPNAGDNFTVEINKLENIDLFTAMQNLINDIKTYSDQPSRLSYHIGIGLDNLENAENRLSEVRSQVGARMSLIETQTKSNEEFIFFAKKAISEIEDLDVVQAISKLVQEQLAYEAAQRSIVRIQQLSLFDFL